MTKTIWNKRFSKLNGSSFTYDGWLDKHRKLLDEYRFYPCLDLGCGNGSDTSYLKSLGMNVFSMDFSVSALEHIKSKNPERIFLGDIRSIPVSKSTFGVIIANLSLHYFDESEMSKIGNTIREIIIPGGYLILRVNSVDDVHYGATVGYMNKVDGLPKYFYTKDMLQEYLSMFLFESLSEYSTVRYGKPKHLIEGLLKKAE